MERASTSAASVQIITRRVPDDQLLSDARTVAARMADGPTTAFSMSLGLIDSITEGMALSRCLDAEADAEGKAVSTSDFSEGKAAFVAKPQPHFTGR